MIDSLCFSVRLVSLAAQKFISDIANDALQHCKMKGGANKNKGKVSYCPQFQFISNFPYLNSKGFELKENMLVY